MPYKAIVVGTDGSKRATIALEEAVALAKTNGAALHAVTMVHPTTEIGYVESFAGQLTVDKAKEAAESIKAHVQSLADRHGVSVQVHSPGGNDPADALINAAQAIGADLIVVGNRGMRGMKRVLGSVPNKVAHKAPCSVLIVDTSEGI